MPSYDYECTECGYRFEEFQAMSDPELTDCPECQQPALRRLIAGGLGVIFKGSGFYINDSRASKSGSSGSSSQGSSEGSSQGSSGSSTAASAGASSGASSSSSGSAGSSGSTPAASAS